MSSAIFRRIRDVIFYPVKKVIGFLQSPLFKRMILKFLNIGSRLPIVLRVIVRVVLGLLLMIGGVFGFLPVLGLWMFPLGVLMIATCIPYFYRRIRVWMRKLRNEIRAAEQNETDLASNPQDSQPTVEAESISSLQDPKIVRRSKKQFRRHQR